MKLQIPVARVFTPLLRRARYKGAWGGRGSAKSWFFAGEAIKAMLEGRNVVCVREIQNSLEDSVKRLLDGRIEEFGLTPFFKSTDREIVCKLSGAVAIFRGMQNHTAQGIKSLEGFDVAWWEEAQTASQQSLTVLMPTIRRPGSELWFSWNPNAENDPIEFLRRDPPENAIVVQSNWQDNPWFPAELRQDLERDRARDPGKYLHIWEGAYQGMSEARIFRNWRVAEMNPPERAVWFGGVDFGFAQDPTFAIRCCVIGDHILYVDHEACEVGVPTEALPMLLAGVPELNRWPSRADSARPETIDYLNRHGYPRMKGAKKGQGSVEDGISFLQGMDIVLHPRCVNLAREFASYAYKVDRRTAEILPVPEDANNHGIDALRYAVERLHRKGKLLPTPEADEPALKPRDYRPRDTGVDNWKTA